ncbi:MAG: hypothetical protein HQL17_02470 [Candidatus Omnitrophica bacterium]|nr:hypothetical protein [Candidatus Omnitrophota bacterium]
MGKAVRPEVDEINRLARVLHGSDAAATAYTFKSLHEHVDEVAELLDAGHEHWKAETVDIIIHAMTLLHRGGVSENAFDALMTQRMTRFKEKIGHATDRR